ncbi:hypothetical protein HHI36_006346 [Cryptolaemus montrouzieri]|uniref:Uncharacterized protein n=1 Tax=Cryptolaemus montrouzieri TaxID=559131 RepID=A0ABD2NXV1_9CUCU
MDTTKKYDNPSPETTANTISKLFLWWLLPFFKYGYYNDLEVKDIFNTTKSNESKYISDALERYWLDEVKHAAKNKTKPSLEKALRKLFWKPFVLVGIIDCFRCIIFTYLMPIALREFINSFSEVPRNNEKGWYLGAIVIFSSLGHFLVNHNNQLFANRMSGRIRVACSSLIYRKILKLDKSSLDDADIGRMVNLLSNDVNRFDNVGVLNYIWIMPVQAATAAYIMYSTVGVAGFVGIGALLFQALPIQGTLSRLQGKLRFKIALRTDTRMKLMNEITSGIQVIKMYAWEYPFQKMVAMLRKYEINLITKTSYVKAISTAIMVYTERFSLYCIATVYVLMGNEINGGIIFSMAQIIFTVQGYMCLMFPIALAYYGEIKTSIFRLEQFLTKSEREENDRKQLDETNNTGVVKLDCVNASWIPNPIVDTLIDVSFELKPGSFCCIVGNVGSGKSSILQLLLKELPLTSGKLRIGGSISYASQEPWLFVSNVRNNILFGQPYYKDVYDKVVEVCALKRDFALFPYGDKTNVGERGISLSGGQRARINLARAIYRDADIYLLDDPLSAVDTHVAKHLFEKCLIQYLHNKTRILVTHQTQFLNQADFVILMNNGKVEKFFQPSEVSTDVLKLLRQTSTTEPAATDANSKRRPSISKSFSIAEEGDDDEEPEETQELIKRGSMQFSVYRDYYKAGASTFVLLFEAILMLAGQFICSSCDLWVTFWTNNLAETALRTSPVDLDASTTDATTYATTSIFNESSLTIFSNLTSSDNISRQNTSANIITELLGVNEVSEITTDLYIKVYTLLIILTIFATTSRAILFFKICMNSSRNLHNLMFTNILQAKMRFFDTNPSGRILNRFSKDMGAIDEILPYATITSIQIFLVTSGILILTLIKSYIMIVPMIIFGTILHYLRKIFMKTAQDVKRLEGITKAPVFSYVAATLNGIPTIRSAHAENMVTNEFDTIQDQHTSTWYIFVTAVEAFGMYMDLLSTAFLMVTSVQFLLRDNVPAGDVGLVISQCLTITGMLQFGMRSLADTANHMTSVERVLQYTKLDKESPFESPPGNKPPRNWPEAGRLVFKNVFLRYAVDEEPVLKNLNIEIEAGEKIGIVGRTGAGKSSLISALFRLAPTDGTIQIDGVDIAKVGLTDLRSKISIIPQEPTLFSESIRYNLDPFGKSDDKSLWQALESVELKNSVESLDSKVSEGGSNFSAGQRQLICLARAIVRNNRVLVMDEATANVDPETDSLIQKTIRRCFEQCTVLTVAHRLNTIMDSDRVIVMDAGEMKEFAAPHELLQNPEGFFTKMVMETGPTMEAKLKTIAEEHYRIQH